jgi:hypothetical protein
MRKLMNGIVADGRRRLSKAVEAKVRAKYEAESAGAVDYWAHVAVEEKIKQEVESELKKLASDQSLWI